MTDSVVIGTRGSKLALWQANKVASLIEQTVPGCTCEVRIVKTKGDKILDVPLAKIGDKGLFTKELESALLDGSVDVCVHSCKDMPTELPEGLTLAGFPVRASACDCIVGPEKGLTLDSLPAGCRVATGSLRRVAQLAHMRPDVVACDIRGNVDTRIAKVASGEFDCAILAHAGIVRLGLEEHVSSVIPADTMVPAVGQGCMAIEVRADDERALALCDAITDDASRRAVEAERFVLAALEGGCQVPMGAHARIEEQGVDSVFVLDAFVSSLDGQRFVRTQVSGDVSDSRSIAERAVDELRKDGAEAILEELR